ncbi:NADH dehydrogenase subunit 2 (mitochondrion) [Myzus persicae]|uniref:NADH-ubiquinone oxidoreductase chain 2 n=2 Tax=Myzus persicae TaxID=13164 RepID=A0A140GMD6_MYZPE|nr:NADH dehydrogenase subunit 2 [Myzus persicae]AKM70079.1 NADH dehydrogenase subunit 2 [Myzus persicae]AMN14572.1 NADH dehydrogenase subunit 2 [Myzus persicae]QHN90085.1 NADH dehydrogenase subunit 2 [Myzus persicae]QOI73445.1 NADH dehydrogenase subunit 2 [Myzus persicae]
MNLNLTKIMFFTLLSFSTLMSISASNWLSMWMGLELNLFSIIPILNFKSSIYSIEATMKYFLIQAFASILLLIFLINKNFMFMNNDNMLIMMPLLMKLSLMPFHLWLPSMMEGLNWFSCLLMMTWQKITPMIMISYLNINKNMIFLIALISMNSIFGLNQNSMRKILAMSSINNSTWMLFAILMNEKLWVNYFLIYSMLNFLIIKMLNNYNINYINQMKFFNLNFFFKLNMLMLIFSIMGLPPMLGFIMKWMLIKTLIYNNMYFIMMMLIMLTILNLFFYIKMTYFMLFNFNIFNKWYLQFKKNNYNFIMMMNFFSLFFSYLFIY